MTSHVMTQARSRLRPWMIVTGALVLLALLGAGACVSTYNRLVRLDQDVRAQWAQVDNAYQRRADLVPNLVATVQGASLLGLDADFGDSTTAQFFAAGARTGKVTFQHAYTTRGTFTTKITVTDASTIQKNASVQVRVE